MRFTFINLIHLLSYAETETQDFPMISLLFRILKSRECWQLPSTCQRRVKDVILSQILITTLFQFPATLICHVYPLIESCLNIPVVFGLNKYVR